MPFAAALRWGLICGALLASVGSGSDVPPLLLAGRSTIVRPNAPAIVFRLRVSANRLTRITLQQNDLDVAATLRTRLRRILAQADEFEYGADSLSYVSAIDDVVELRIDIVAKHSDSAFLTVSEEAPREPTAADLLRRDAENLSTKVKSPAPGLS